jgi:Leucine-rich repeat (LRR) protein
MNHLGLSTIGSLVCLISILGCQDDNSSNSLMKRIPDDDKWGVFFSPVLGVSESDLNSWCLLEGEMIYFRTPESRASVSDIELDRLKNGELKLFDCTKYLIDELLIETLRKSRSVIALRIGPREQTESFEWISELSNLKVLDIGNNDFSASELSWLAKLDMLQSLSISNCKLPLSKVNWLPACPELRDLQANGVVFSDAHLALMPEFPKLQRLELYRSEVSDTGFNELPRIAKSLEFLWLVRNKEITSASFPTFGRLKRLRFVHLGSTVIEETEYQSYRGGGGGVPSLEKLLPDCVFMFGT